MPSSVKKLTRMSLIKLVCHTIPGEHRVGFFSNVDLALYKRQEHIQIQIQNCCRYLMNV